MTGEKWYIFTVNNWFFQLELFHEFPTRQGAGLQFLPFPFFAKAR